MNDVAGVLVANPKPNPPTDVILNWIQNPTKAMPQLTNRGFQRQSIPSNYNGNNAQSL